MKKNFKIKEIKEPVTLPKESIESSGKNIKNEKYPNIQSLSSLMYFCLVKRKIKLQEEQRKINILRILNWEG